MHTKRISIGYGKKPKWVTTPRPGPHPKNESIPLMILLRDMLKYADTSREVKKILNDGLIMVDKKIRKDPKFGIGLMDTIEIPRLKRYFRVLPGSSNGFNGLILKEIPKKEVSIKPCRIMNKTIIKNGAIQLNLHDGTNIVVDSNEYKTKDTLILELPERRIKDWIKFENGNFALVVKGRHSGKSGIIKEISEASATKKSLTTIDGVQTLTEYVFVIGKEKPMITI
ncbi:MAG: 30S ribosomal protein S4e [Candidatus Altiarchaeales archaeon]|nr:MAG: 30S ribosomal protein S4e [Candidatus Altiarchaeales archaeon]RLI95096.1 MAG: 30S ribosomal protein S4e [Candidatus Altiarchaeales archaeon]RLI95486.1 MAG: 30S ribosomal protein S4e [Candidatus Altiarchaeales archaeon]HDO81932.1 30S ribosomal protein S4e [Candidatus Altiarchaeales archaeon]HEX54581.1 30S ribosomal protein S4e [Candidatus Altiarchaeales archaeon]